jgi:tetratricopeptide (TPR) repeat protein
MWHLIIPPIIIVSSIALLSWYLSRRMAEPELLAKMDAAKGSVESGAKARALSRREFFLKLSERFASWFKVTSLRVHNFFQSSTEHIRERRMKVQEMRRIAENVSLSAKDRLASISKPSFSSWWRSRNTGEEHGGQESHTVSDETSERKSIPEERPVPGASAIFGRTTQRQFFGKKELSSEKKSEAETVRVIRPLIREKATLPERPKPKRKEPWKESSLIRKIAENPKDISAYESLGDYYFSVESMEDAKECYRQILKLQPTNRSVKLKIRKLEKFFEKKGV